MQTVLEETKYIMRKYFIVLILSIIVVACSKVTTNPLEIPPFLNENNAN